MRPWLVTVSASLMILTLVPYIGTPGEEPRNERALELSLHTDRPIYRAGQPVQFRLSLSNRSTAAVVLHCKDAQRFDLAIADRSGKQIWRWSEDQMFAQMQGEETIKPGKSRAYTAVFSGTLPPGEYRATGTIVCRDPSLSTETVFTVR
jgi:hypothetical protein